MSLLKNLLLENKAWVAEKTCINPDYFRESSKDQTPRYLWIGCSDSRVNPSDITGTALGEMFVHRNIANLVHSEDLNLLSVITYAVNYLGVKHIIVCGHYGCGGVMASLSDRSFGIIDAWLKNIKRVIQKFKSELDQIDSEKGRLNRLVELNVIQQAEDVSLLDVVNKAIQEKDVTVHGWVYDMSTGLLKELSVIDKNGKRPQN